MDIKILNEIIDDLKNFIEKKGLTEEFKEYKRSL